MRRAAILLAGLAWCAACGDDEVADTSFDCPLSLPAAGSPCPRENVLCPYGSADCPTSARCQDHAWTVSTPTCAPPPTCEPAGRCACTCGSGEVRDPTKTCAEAIGSCAAVCCVPGDDVPDAATDADADTDAADADAADAIPTDAPADG